MSDNILNPLDESKYIDDYLSAFIKEEFTKPIINNIFFINIDYLKENSQVVEFKTKYDFSPQAAAIDYYNNKFFYPIIMLVNNCPSIFKFHSAYYQKILIPSLDSIVNIYNSIQ
jgi:hypothetical protein